MSRYPGKKLPPGWVYIPSRRDVRKSLTDLPAEIQLDLAGTGHFLSPLDSFMFGLLDRRVVEAAWCFELRLWGAPEAVVGAARDDLARAAVHAIRRWVADCLTIPPADELEPSQKGLWFRTGPDGVTPEFHAF